MSDKDEPKTPDFPPPLQNPLPNPMPVYLWAHTHISSSGAFFVPIPISPDYQEPPQDHPIYNWVGRIAAKLANLEHDLDKLIWKVSGVSEDVGACITGPLLGYSSKFLVLIALLKQLNFKEGIIKRAMQLNQDADTQAEERNRCIHDVWLLETSSKTLHQRKSVTRKDVKKGPKEKLTFGITPKSEKELEDTLKAISNLIERLSNLHADIVAERRT